MPSPLVIRVKEVRQARGMSQQTLAAEVGLSRQALSAVEAGRSVPGTDVALALARALDTRVEALFGGPQAPPRVEARLAGGGTSAREARVLLSQVEGAWVARPLGERGAEALQGADGIVTASRGGTVEVELLHGVATARDRLVVMGCAPALGILAARLSAPPRRVPLAWVHGTSAQALDALEKGEVHLAGIHLRDARSGRFNLPQVQRRFGQRKMLLVTFATWEQGLVVAPGNPLALKKVEDLLRPRVRVVQREPGSGAAKLLEQLLARSGAPALKAPIRVARGHLEVAQAVAHGAADAGIAIQSVALAWGLDFVPLSSERFDLVFPEALAGDERLERLVDELGSAGFRRELESVGGYETAQSGHVLSASGGGAGS